MEARDSMSWRKSSFTGNGGANCVEVGVEREDPRWRKSSRSGNGGNNCVEVGTEREVGHVLVRDTKDRQGGVLSFGSTSWGRFIERLKG
jgi:hypothetical protein